MNKKLLVLINSLHTGGAENHLCQVLPGLKAKGWDISVFLTLGAGELIPKLENSGITVIQPKLFFLPLNFVQLCYYLIRNRPNIVQFMLPTSYLFGGMACLITRQKTLIMGRRSMNNYQQKYPLLAKLEKWLHTKMACIIANNREALLQLEQDEHVPTQKLRLVYNGIDLRRFDQLSNSDTTALRKHFALPDSALTLIVVANLIPYKGHITLLQALAQIQDQLPSSWQLLCVGNKTAYLDELQQAAIDLNIANNVHWLGMQPAVESLLAISDIAICCSYEEGFSNAILEAMAAGLPVIATNVGGNPESVVNGETGILVPAKDPAALGQAIANLASDHQLMSKMGQAGAKRICKFFSLQACVDSYHQVYSSL